MVVKIIDFQILAEESVMGPLSFVNQHVCSCEYERRFLRGMECEAVGRGGAEPERQDNVWSQKFFRTPLSLTRLTKSKFCDDEAQVKRCVPASETVYFLKSFPYSFKRFICFFYCVHKAFSNTNICGKPKGEEFFEIS